MKEKLNSILTALLKAQDYINGEMEAICDVDAMDEAKEVFEELDDAVVRVRSLLNESDETNNEFNRTWVGYQVKTKNDEFLPPYTDKDVFRTIDDAQNIIRSQKKSIIISPEEDENLVIESRWLENEDEEKRNFLFHGEKKRDFDWNEKVWDDNNSEWVNVHKSSFVCKENDIVALRDSKKDYYTAPADSLYQLAGDKTCPRCGGPLCREHHDHIDYPFYCPCCQENFYNIEIN